MVSQPQILLIYTSNKLFSGPVHLPVHGDEDFLQPCRGSVLVVVCGVGHLAVLLRRRPARPVLRHRQTPTEGGRSKVLVHPQTRPDAG